MYLLTVLTTSFPHLPPSWAKLTQAHETLSDLSNPHYSPINRCFQPTPFWKCGHFCQVCCTSEQTQGLSGKSHGTWRQWNRCCSRSSSSCMQVPIRAMEESWAPLQQSNQGGFKHQPKWQSAPCCFCLWQLQQRFTKHLTPQRGQTKLRAAKLACDFNYIQVLSNACIYL